MSITSITAGGSAALASFEPGRLKQQRESYQALSSALESGDIGSAKQAYVSLAQNAREGATLKAGSPFAQLGKALATENLPAAQEAFKKLGNGIVPAPSLPSEPTAPIVKAPSLPAQPPVYAPPVYIAPPTSGTGTLLASA